MSLLDLFRTNSTVAREFYAPESLFAQARIGHGPISEGSRGDCEKCLAHFGGHLNPLRREGSSNRLVVYALYGAILSY